MFDILKRIKFNSFSNPVKRRESKNMHKKAKTYFNNMLYNLKETILNNDEIDLKDSSFDSKVLEYKNKKMKSLNLPNKLSIRENTKSSISNDSFFSNQGSLTKKSNLNSNNIINPNIPLNPNPLNYKANRTINDNELSFPKKFNNLTLDNDEIIFKKGSLKPKNIIYKKLCKTQNLFGNNQMKTKSVTFESPKKKISSKTINKNDKRSEKNIFGFLKKPEYLYDNNNNKNNTFVCQFNSTNSFKNENDHLFSKTRISNKNILELNEITQELKKSLIIAPTNKKLSHPDITKTYINENQNNDIFEELQKIKNNNNNNQTIIKEEEEENYLEKYRDLQRKGLVYDSFDEFDDDEEISKYFIQPNSHLLIILDFIIIVCIFYDLIYIPLFLGMNDLYCNQGSFWKFFNIVELVIDCIYIFDLFIFFFVGFYEEDILKTGIKSMFIHYLKNWFIINFLTAIPFKTIFTIFDKSCKDIGFLSSYKYSNQFFYLLICIRLIKVLRLIHNKFFEYCEEKLDKYEIYNNYLGFIKGITVFFLTLHVVSCIFIFIGKNDNESWINKFNFQENNFSELYFLGIYYLITTVTTVGYGDLTCTTPNEKVFGIIIEIVGIVAYSWILTSISNYVKSKSDQKEEYFQKYKILEDIKISYDDFSDDLFQRIDRYIKHKHKNENEEKNLIEELPISLRNTLVYNMYEPIIQNFVFFKYFDNKDFIVSVIFAFKPIIAIKNDILIKDGEFVEDIIFVKSGKITLEYPIKIKNKDEGDKKQTGLYHSQLSSKYSSIKGQNTKKFANFIDNFLLNNTCDNNSFEEEESFEIQKIRILDIRKNEHFGDILMFSNERSPLCATVKSRKAELFYLNKKDAIDISKSYSIIWHKIQRISSFNMQQIRRLMMRLEKIFYRKIGLIYHENSLNSNDSEEELASIPTISEENEFNNDLENLEPSLNSKKPIKKNEFLGTIREATRIEDDEDNYSNHSSKSNDKLDVCKTKKFEIGIQSESSKLDDDSISNSQKELNKEIEKDNNNDDLSRSMSLLEIKRKFFNTNYEYTPFKPEEINYEIYPNENFMEIKTNRSQINSNKKYNELINKLKNKCNDEHINEENCKNTNFNESNISICSTEISFSINRDYVNINEISDFKFSKSPKLRKKVINLLKEFDEDKSDKEKIKKHNSNHVILKSSSFDLFKKKKGTNQVNRKEKSYENVRLMNRINKKKSFLEMIKDNIKKNNEVEKEENDDPSPFTNILKKFIKNDDQNEFPEEKEELNLKMKKLETMKKERKISINQLFKNNLY